MNSHHASLLLLLVGLSLIFAGFVWADRHAEGNDNYVIWSGGVGIDERATSPNLKDHIKLVFFENSGPYLANIAVTLTDASGRQVAEQIVNGPWLILNLPDGKYTVTATRISSGERQRVSFEAGDSGQEIALMFSAASP